MSQASLDIELPRYWFTQLPEIQSAQLDESIDVQNSVSVTTDFLTSDATDTTTDGERNSADEQDRTLFLESYSAWQMGPHWGTPWTSHCSAGSSAPRIQEGPASIEENFQLTSSQWGTLNVSCSSNSERWLVTLQSDEQHIKRHLRRNLTAIRVALEQSFPGYVLIDIAEGI